MKKYKNLILSSLYIIIGIVLVVLSVKEILDQIYCGFGGGLIGVGIINLAKAIKYTSDSEYKEKVDTQNNDERNRFLSMKAWSWAGYMLVMIFAIATIVFMIIGKTLFMQISSGIVCIIVFLYWISYIIISRKY